jgi:hypothetical protein
MASSIQLLRSNNAKERPFPGNLLDGQPAINTNEQEPGLFFKVSDGSIVKIGPASITSDGSPPNSNSQGLSGNSKGELWLDASFDPPVFKIYDGSTWVAVSASTVLPGAVGTLQLADGAVTDVKVNASAAISSSKLSFTPASSQGITTTVQSKLRQWISALDFGVSPTATAVQNRQRLNHAFRFLHDNGGGTLHVPAGIYQLSGVLSMGRNTTLKCETGVKFIRTTAASFLTNRLDITSAVGGYNGNGDIVIDGGIWDFNSTAVYQAGNHFAIGYADNVIIRNCTFLDNIRAHAVDLSACRNVLIENNKFLGFSWHKTSPDGYGTSSDSLEENRQYSEAVQLDHNVPGSLGFGAIDRTQCENVVFRNNVIGPNPERNDNTFTSWGVGIGGHGAVNDRFMTGIIIEGNQFIECIFAGVRGYKWVDTSIIGNVFRGCQRGVHVTPVSYTATSANNPDGTPSGQGQAGKGYAIAGNVFDTSLDLAVLFTAPTFNVSALETFYHEDVTISGNTFRNGFVNSTISCRWVKNLAITGNSFRDVYRGIELRFVSSAVVSGNNILNSQREFLFFQEDTPTEYQSQGYSSDLIVSGNVARNIAFTGIHLQRVQNASVLSNQLTNVSTFEPTRFGILYNIGAKDGFISGNLVQDGGAPVKPEYGIRVTSTCENVTVGQNKSFGAVGAILNQSTSVQPSITESFQVLNGIQVGSGVALWTSGTGSPEGVVTAPVGSLFTRTNGGVGSTLYIKESGTGSTGWVAK